MDSCTRRHSLLDVQQRASMHTKSVSRHVHVLNSKMIARQQASSPSYGPGFSIVRLRPRNLSSKI